MLEGTDQSTINLPRVGGHASLAKTSLARNEIGPREDNKLRINDRAAHQWYRFVLSFPPHLVRDYAAKFGLSSSHRVLDPFCGTGTTLVECQKLGQSGSGAAERIEHPMARTQPKLGGKIGRAHV